jgi:hypothetical protein
MAVCLALALTLKRNECRVVHVMSRYPLIAIDLLRWPKLPFIEGSQPFIDYLLDSGQTISIEAPP